MPLAFTQEDFLVIVYKNSFLAVVFTDRNSRRDFWVMSHHFYQSDLIFIVLVFALSIV